MPRPGAHASAVAGGGDHSLGGWSGTGEVWGPGGAGGVNPGLWFSVLGTMGCSQKV